MLRLLSSGRVLRISAARIWMPALRMPSNDCKHRTLRRERWNLVRHPREEVDSRDWRTRLCKNKNNDKARGTSMRIATQACWALLRAFGIPSQVRCSRSARAAVGPVPSQLRPSHASKDTTKGFKAPSFGRALVAFFHDDNSDQLPLGWRGKTVKMPNTVCFMKNTYLLIT